MSGLRTAALLLLLGIALSALVWVATAEDTNGSYVIVEMPQLDYNFTHMPGIDTYRIMQGGNVYLNDTIDISGMGWGTGVAWYGRYGEYDDPVYIREFQNYRSDVMNFYIDPAIFGTRLGMWYQYYGNASAGERNGNLKAFNVMGRTRNVTMTFPNGTVINQTEYLRNGSYVKPLVIPNPSLLPEIHEADYLLAIGDPLIVKTYGPAQVWVFGREDKAYGSTDNDNMTFDTGTFTNFEPGSYTMIVQHTGNNTDYDVRLNGSALQYKNGWKGVQNVDVSALQPRMVMDRLKTLLAGTDDDYTAYTVEVQEPSITIRSVDDVWLKSKMLKYRIDFSADVTFKDIRGYTNLQNGTAITVMLDKEYNGIGKPRFTTDAELWRSAPGNRTIFQAYIPIIWDTMPLGMHTITALGPDGTYADANFPVELLPPNSFRPNTTLKYTGDANPWKPNLTTPTPLPPIVVTKTVTITVPVTPSNETVYEQQRKAEEDIVVSWVTLFAMIAISMLIIYLTAKYGLSVWRRL